MTLPLLATLDMGYGHLRAALPLAEALGVPVVEVDRPPCATPEEQKTWLTARRLYEGASRGVQTPLIGGLVRSALEAFTAIAPLHPYRDQSAPTREVRVLDRLIRGGLGRGLARRLDEEGRPLLATYFTPALSADRHARVPVDCVVTDSDLSRAWVPRDPAASRIRWFAPSRRAVQRLRAYGVPRERIRLTGFPLPPSLLGGPDLPVLRSNLAARIVRLDPSGSFREARRREIEATLGPLPSSEEGRPPTIVYAVGGAGAQAGIARELLSSLRAPLESGRLRLALVAGTRADVAERFASWIRREGLERCEGLTILHAPTFGAYYAAFNALLARADVLWTKPSELTFYGALGIPLVLAPPLGAHEVRNRRWARERGAALTQRNPRWASQWLSEWLDEGVLCAAAWAGHAMLPSRGTYVIAEAVRASS